MDPARELGERGLSEAMDRLRARLGMEWYEVPFTEALLWITALKDFHGTGIYYTTTEGETLRALGWARNYAAHELLTLTDVNLASSGLLGAGVLGMSMQGGPGNVVWVKESSLPLGRHEPDSRRAVYQVRVAGRSILEPLQMAMTYLMSLP